MFNFFKKAKKVTEPSLEELSKRQKNITETIHKNSVSYGIVDKDWGMYEPEMFTTEEKARERIASNKEKHKNHEYWSNRESIVYKQTIEILG